MQRLEILKKYLLFCYCFQDFSDFLWKEEEKFKIFSNQGKGYYQTGGCLGCRY